jgi:hypothetical protein
MITIDRKDARVLWNVKFEDRDAKITDLIVEEFLLDPITKTYNNQHLYEIYHRDIGNCTSGWEKVTNARILFDIFAEHSAQDAKTRQNIIRELFKIKEFRAEFQNIMHRYFSDDEVDEYTEQDNDTTTTQR